MKKHLLILGLIISTSFGVFAQEADSYQYMTITQRDFQIFISTGDAETEKIKNKSYNASLQLDFKDLLALIEKKEQEGWELMSSQIIWERDLINYNVLRKMKD